MDSIEDKITKYCIGYYLTHGHHLEELTVNYEEYAELMRGMASHCYRYPTATTSTSAYTSMYYRIDNYQIKITAGLISMLSYKNGLQKMKERLKGEIHE
jgi:hypothetical protein